jgi:hypothetical protein
LPAKGFVPIGPNAANGRVFKPAVWRSSIDWLNGKLDWLLRKGMRIISKSSLAANWGSSVREK